MFCYRMGSALFNTTLAKIIGLNKSQQKIVCSTQPKFHMTFRAWSEVDHTFYFLTLFILKCSKNMNLDLLPKLNKFLL